MVHRGHHIWRDENASAAAEMALVAPLLLILMFGAMELGKYFLDEHVLAKAVRDGARYAARQPFTEYAGCAPSATVTANTQNLTRTGQIASGGTQRLPYWDATENGDASVELSVDCSRTPPSSTGISAYSGIYAGSSLGAPVVTVSANVRYEPILPGFGVVFDGLDINARSEATVTGV